MILPLAIAVAGAGVALAAWAGTFAVRDRAVVLRQLYGAGLVEVLLVIQAVAVAALSSGDRTPADPLLLWGYLATGLVLLPIAAAWAFAERSRWSSVVLLVAACTVAFLQLRLWQIWSSS